MYESSHWQNCSTYCGVSDPSTLPGTDRSGSPPSGTRMVKPNVILSSVLAPSGRCLNVMTAVAYVGNSIFSTCSVSYVSAFRRMMSGTVDMLPEALSYMMVTERVPPVSGTVHVCG